LQLVTATSSTQVNSDLAELQATQTNFALRGRFIKHRDQKVDISYSPLARIIVYSLACHVSHERSSMEDSTTF